MSKVLFVSQNPLERAENIKAVWDAYDGEKEFRHGLDYMINAEQEGFSAVVCDTLSRYMVGKDKCKLIAICHAITGNKYYGLHEQGSWVIPEAFEQTDYAIAASKTSVSIVAGQLGIPEERVIPTGIPRTDAYIGAVCGDGGTLLSFYQSYLYVPTYRDQMKGGWLPRVNWGLVDSLLTDDELLAVKRHYFTQTPILPRGFKHIIELDPMEPSAKYLIDCDVLITDYSSIEFDGYLIGDGKPAILTTDDMTEYLRDRGMYYLYPDDYSSRYLSIECNEYELVNMLREAAANGLNDTERQCKERLAGACDGNSTKRVCDLIRTVANGGEYAKDIH